MGKTKNILLIDTLTLKSKRMLNLQFRTVLFPEGKRRRGHRGTHRSFKVKPASAKHEFLDIQDLSLGQTMRTSLGGSQFCIRDLRPKNVKPIACGHTINKQVSAQMQAHSCLTPASSCSLPSSTQRKDGQEKCSCDSELTGGF